MNRFFVKVFGMIALGALVGVSTVEAQAGRIGYVNTQVIMAEAPGTAEAQAAFEADMVRFRAELATLESQLDTLQQNFERQQATLSPTARQERQAAIQQTFATYQTRQTELEAQAQQRQEELVAPIMQKIAEVIDNIRVEGNYAVIFDAAGGMMMAADPALDLTQQVLERLRAAIPAPATSTTP
jgi:outer membrane protein